MVLTRREMLRRTARLPLIALAIPILEGCSSDPECADPELLSRGEEQMRKTLEYVEHVPDMAQRCGGCQFFKASGEDGGVDQGTCGYCEILDGMVSSHGFCTSWAERS